MIVTHSFTIYMIKNTIERITLFSKVLSYLPSNDLIMSEKQEEKSKLKDDNDLSEPQSIKLAEKDQNEKQGERSLEEIEKELDELRPKPPSPKAKHRIEEEEKKKDQEIEKGKAYKESSVPSETKSNNEDKNHQHKDNELTPGQPDPTVNDDFKIPILNDHGDIELEPQRGSALNKHKNTNQSTENNKKHKE